MITLAEKNGQAGILNSEIANGMQLKISKVSAPFCFYLKKFIKI